MMITVLVLNGVANILTFINMLIAGAAGKMNPKSQTLKTF